MLLSTLKAGEEHRIMIICHCLGMTDREIRKAAREGSRSGDARSGCLAAGSACGGCAPAVREIVEAERGGSSASRDSRPEQGAPSGRACS